MRKAVGIIIALFIMLPLSSCAQSKFNTTATTPQQSAFPSANKTPAATSGNISTQSAPSLSTSPQVTRNKYDPKKIIIDEMTDDNKGTVYLGQDSVDTRQIMRSLGVYFNGDDTLAYSDSYAFYFGEKGTLNKIEVLPSSLISTKAGLAFGDNYDNMVKLYGTDFLKKDINSDAALYRYTIGRHCFYVKLEKGLVTEWGICTLTYADENFDYFR